jgi:hypothetical protein
MLDAGVRAAWAASSHAARMMVKRRSGLIVNTGYWTARKYMAPELLSHGLTVASLYPGLLYPTARVRNSSGGSS